MHHLGPVLISLDLIAEQKVLGHNIIGQDRLCQLGLSILPDRAECLGSLHQLQAQSAGHSQHDAVSMAQPAGHSQPGTVNSSHQRSTVSTVVISCMPVLLWYSTNAAHTELKSRICQMAACKLVLVQYARHMNEQHITYSWHVQQQLLLHHLTTLLSGHDEIDTALSSAHEGIDTAMEPIITIKGDTADCPGRSYMLRMSCTDGIMHHHLLACSTCLCISPKKLQISSEIDSQEGCQNTSRHTANN